MSTTSLPISNESIQRVTQQIVERFLPRKVILFGSYAYGQSTADSDVDLLVVIDTVKCTPMQWSGDRNGGFSRAEAERLYFPVIRDAVYGYETVHVEAQLRTEDSLLRWLRQLIAVRKQYCAFGRGSLEILHPENQHVLV